MLYCDTTAGVATRLMSAMAAERLRRRAGRGDRQILQRVERIDLILRRLHDDRVAHAVVGIEPEGRLHLARAGEVDDHAVGHVALGDADILRARPIDVDVEAGSVERLLDARVDQTRDVAQPAQQLLRIGEIRRRDSGRGSADRSAPARRN